MRIPSWDEWKELGQIFREVPASFKAEVIEPCKRDFKEIFCEKYDHRYLKAGDVIGAPYTQKDCLYPYEHYGIYIGNDKVIHFASKKEGEPKSVHKISLVSFASRQTGTFFLIDFDKYFEETPIDIMFPLSAGILRNGRKNISAKETVRRAKSKLGETGYSLLFNNCEHFAMWCKTGSAECGQLIPNELDKYRVHFSLKTYR